MVQNQALNGQFFSIEMYDDGNSGDGDEGDIIYGATIPFNSSGDQVRYYIRASNDDALVLEPRQAEWEYYHFTVGSVLADSNIVINEICSINSNNKLYSFITHIIFCKSNTC